MLHLAEFSERAGGMGMDRREFVGRSALVAGGLILSGRETWAAPSSQTDLLPQMSWMNEPASAKINGAEIAVRSRAKTDFWQKTFDGYVADSGHFFHLPASGNFTFSALINGKYAAQYDQAGLMVRIDAENWMRCGTEFIDGKRYASVVFTRTYSDGSTLPDLSETEPIWWRVVRKNDSIETFCSLDGDKFMSVRMGYFPKRPTVEVGLMCAAPSGPGFDASFKALKLETSTA
jgi:uncharacterized protein